MSRSHHAYESLHYAPREGPESSDLVDDFAFADTMMASDDAPPASAIIVSDPSGEDENRNEPRYFTDDRGITTRVRFAWAEMNLLWSATASLEEIHDRTGAVVYDEDPFVRAATVGRRVRTLFSFFEWDRADVLRAAWIGLAVFVLAATVGAIALQVQSTPTKLEGFDRGSSTR